MASSQGNSSSQASSSSSSSQPSKKQRSLTSFFEKSAPVTDEQRHDRSFRFPKPGASSNSSEVREKLSSTLAVRDAACEMLGISMVNKSAGAPSDRLKQCRNAVTELCKAWNVNKDIVAQEYFHKECF